MSDKTVDMPEVRFALYAQLPVVQDWEPEENVVAFVDYPITEEGVPQPQVYTSDRLTQTGPLRDYMDRSQELLGKGAELHPRYVLVEGRVPDGAEALAEMVGEPVSAPDASGRVFMRFRTRTLPSLSDPETVGVIHTLALIGYQIAADNQPGEA